MFESITLPPYLLALQERIDARVMRERVLILLTVLAFIFMLWNFLIQSSIDKKTQQVNDSLVAIATQRATLQTQIAATTQSLMNDPDKQKKEQIAQLQTDISGVADQLQQVSQNLIRAEQLPQALQDVLQKTRQVTLLEVKTLPAQELHFTEASTTAAAQSSTPVKEASAGVYQHAVELRVSGNFSQIMQLLVALESLPWRFYWQNLSYAVEHYPNAEVTLRVYTLSSDEGLFGV